MANYITVGSKFKPFSYAELIQPIKASTEAHQNIENTYGELMSKASIWENLANSEKDKNTYLKYKEFADNLRNEASILAEEGLSTSSKRNLLNMQKQYVQDIVPIEMAYKRRQDLIDEQRRGLLNNDSLLYNINYDNVSLDDLIKNPESTYTSYSGNTIYLHVKNAASNLAAKMLQNPSDWYPILGRQYFEILRKPGVTIQDILKVVNNDPRGKEYLNKIVEEAVDASGIKNWNNQNVLDRAYEYGNMGLWDALGKDYYDTLSNKAYGLKEEENNDSDSDYDFSTIITGVTTPENTSSEGSENLVTSIDFTEGNSQSIFEKYPNPTDRQIVEFYSSMIKTNETEALLAKLDKLHELQEKVNAQYERKKNIPHIKESLGATLAGYATQEEELNAELASIYRKFYEYDKEYSYLFPDGGSHKLTSDLGIAFDNIQNKEVTYTLPYNADKSLYNEVREGMSNFFGTITKKEYENNPSLQLLDEDGDSLDYDDFSKIVLKIKNDKGEEEKTKTTYSVKRMEDGTFKLIFTNNGKAYHFNNNIFDKFETDLNTIDKYLKDFRYSSINTDFVNIDDNIYNRLLNNNGRIDRDLLNYINDSIKNIEGTDFYGVALLNERNADVIKLIFNKDGKLVGMNNIYSEINGRGKNRQKYLNNYSYDYLSGLSKIVADKSKKE